jgi:dolichol-phosphate mannosyltransferase
LKIDLRILRPGVKPSGLTFLESLAVKTLIVIPTYNEVENIGLILRAVLEQTPVEVEVLVVDDGSPDGTSQKVEEVVRDNPRVHLMKRKGKMGLGTAYVAGFKWALAEGFGQMIEMDADFSHHPSYLPTMLAQLAEGADVAVGSRYVSGGGTVNWGLGRKILSRGGSLYSRMILGASIRDFTGGFNGWKRAVIEAVDIDSLRSDGYSFQIELKYRAYLRGFKIVEFPIVFEDRKVGHSKMNRRIVFEALRRVWGFRLNASSFRRAEQSLLSSQR